MNKEQKLIKQLKKASLLVREESMRVNKEFSQIEYDIEDKINITKVLNTPGGGETVHPIGKTHHEPQP